MLILALQFTQYSDFETISNPLLFYKRNAVLLARAESH